MTPSTLDVAVIIIGRNACKYLRQALQSLRASRWQNCSHEVIYVDNGSTDGTREMLREFPEVKALFNQQNLGFCKAGNQAAAVTSSRHFFFLNDDTIVLNDAIACLVHFLDQTPEAGIVGARLLYPDLSEQWSGRRFPTPLNGLLGRRSWLTHFFPNIPAVRSYLFKDQIAGEYPFAVDWVSAAALMVRREVFHSVGGLVEGYYYFHEAVFCDRASRAGWKTYLYPQSRIIHYEGKGSGARPFRVLRWHVKNFHSGAFRFYCEHHGLGRLHLRRWMAGTLILTRAALLTLGHGVACMKRSVLRQNETLS